jgi:hypothetical protein
MELQPESMTEAEIRAELGRRKTRVSHREFVRLRQEGFILIATQRTGLGKDGGRGTRQLKYKPDNIRLLLLYKALHGRFKKKDECRWRLWCDEGLPVRMGRDLADTLDQSKEVIKTIKSADDIVTKLIPWLKPAYAHMPRSNPLRVICRKINEDELRSLTIMIASVVLGIKQPLFDEPNPYALKVLRRVFGLSEEFKLPPNFFDIFPDMHGQLITALRTASPDELEFAGVVCRGLSHFFDNPENWRRGAIEIAGGTLPWRLIKFAGLMWPSPITRALTVAFVILWIRAFRKEIAPVVMAVVTAISAAFASAGSPRAEN